MDRVDTYFASDDAPAPELITGALWAVCHGGHRSAAKYLLARGGDPNWIGWGDLTALDVAIQEDHPSSPNGFAPTAPSQPTSCQPKLTERHISQGHCTSASSQPEGASSPLEFEGIRKRHLPEDRAHTKAQHHKGEYALRAAAMVRAGVDPGLLGEVSWWRTDDLWFWALEALVTHAGCSRTRRRNRPDDPRRDREPPRRSNSQPRPDLNAQIARPRPHRTHGGQVDDDARGTDVMKKRSAASA
jgi:hypothetical protein